MNRTLIAALFCALIPLHSSAKPAQSPRPQTQLEKKIISPRLKNRLGVYATLLGEPYPALISGNLAYNIVDFFRLSAGAGYTTGSATDGSVRSDFTASTIGAQGRFLVPGWELSPSIGIGWAMVTVHATGLVYGIDVGGFSADGNHIYSNLGVDWQSPIGFHAAAGINLSYVAGVPVAPYLSLGWFFDVGQWP